MKKYFSLKSLEVIIILILGLTPLLWFHGKEVVLGHDSGLPINTVAHFLDRFYAWTQRYGFGNDQTYAIPGMMIHGLEAFVTSLGASLQTEQKITFIFWFLLPGLTMYLFARRLEKQFSLSFVALPASVFYMFNHFLLQGWFIAERTKFSLYAALPLLLILLFDWKDKKRSSLFTSVLISLTFFILNGEASLPLFGGIIVAIMTFVVFYFIEFFTLKALFRSISLFILTLVITIFIQAYWLLPYAQFVLKSYQQTVTFFGGTQGIVTWIDYISENSSLINLLRLQGIPEWYENPLHPFAGVFLHNPFLIAVSVAFPLLAFGSLLLYSEKKVLRILLFFAFMALFSMIFVAGSHEPFGPIYLFLIKFVPGFLAFRTPFYKFGPALWFSYAILISFSLNYFLTWLQKRNYMLCLSVFFLSIIGIILYSYPFLTGIFFNYEVGVRSTKIVMPSYVTDFGHWISQPQQKNERVLMLPAPNVDGKVEAYTWGYWSLAPLATFYSDTSIIDDSFYFSTTEESLLQELYSDIRDNNPYWVKMASLLNINYLVMRNDFAWNLSDSPTYSPAFYQAALHSPYVKKIKSFGAWDVYAIKKVTNTSSVLTAKGDQYFDGNSSDIGLLASLPHFSTNVPVYASSDKAANVDELFNLRETYYIEPDCIMCNMQWEVINPAEYTPLITRDSMFYKYLHRSVPVNTTPSADNISALAYTAYENDLEFAELIDEKKPESTIIDSGQAYIQSLNELSDVVSAYKQENKHIVFDDTSLFNTISILRNQRIPLADAINKINGVFGDYTVMGLLQEGITQTSQLRETMEEIINIPLSNSDKHFVFSSRLTGPFTMYYRPNDERKNVNNIIFNLNGKNVKGTLTSDQNGWYRFGTVSLAKGNEELIVHQPVNNLYNPHAKVTIQSQADGGCYISKPISGETGDVVNVSFTDKLLQGNQTFYIKFTPTKDISNFYDVNAEISANTAPSVYSTTYELGSSDPYNFIICTLPVDDKDAFSPSAIELTNISFYKVAVPDVFFESGKISNTQKALPITTKNNTSLTFSNPSGKHILLFDQSYNDNWQTNISGAQHFFANGYENAWVVDNNTSQSMIFYAAQIIVQNGFKSTIITVFIIIVYLIYKLIKKHEK